jgi:FMN-dependent NADH-azoreductase
VTRRDVARDPIGGDAWATAAVAGFVPEEDWTSEQRAARAVAAHLADEVASADVIVIAAPLHNFGVSQPLKTWVDLLITDPRFAPGTQTVAGRPAFLVIARGGGYGEGTPCAGWDHATGWIRRILKDMRGLDLDVIETEPTLAEVTPQMAELRHLAREQMAESHEPRAAMADRSRSSCAVPLPDARDVRRRQRVSSSGRGTTTSQSGQRRSGSR